MARSMVVPAKDWPSVSPVAVLPAQIGTAKTGSPSGHSPDPRRFRALYPDRWVTFLHAHFRDHLHVAYAFGVSERTSRDWWEGKTASQGWAVAYAGEIVEGAEQILRGQA